MKHRLYVISLVLFLVSTILIMAIGCEPAPLITFDNRQNQEVRIFLTHVRDDGSIDGFVELGTISANSTETHYITFLGDDFVNRIQIRDTLGNVIFTHDYKMADLEKLDWKIVISP
jgi:hypothetical protein